MVIFHIAWDGWYLGLWSTDPTAEPGWVALQRGIVTSFLLLVGVSLALAHGGGIRWRPFWRRFAVIAAAAGLTSLGTFVVFPDYFVYFGILHAIAVFSLIGLALVRAPLWVVIGAGLAVLIPPSLVTHPAMSAKPLSWVGFWPVPPPTTDIVPVFPWLGVVLCGIALTRIVRGSALWDLITRWRGEGRIGRPLRWLGRWSLIIYLLHQPLLFGAMSLVAPPPAPDPIAFVSSCETSCRELGSPQFCARYCLCALEQVEQQSLWAEVATVPQTPAIAAMTQMCSLMAAD